MKFCFVDRITKVEEGVGITVTKAVSFGEDYLADHFPGAPIMPGAMMMEAAIEAACWFLRKERGFSAEDYNVSKIGQAKFSRVLRPGDVLTIDLKKLDESEDRQVFSFRAKGSSSEGAKVFSLRFSLRLRSYEQSSVASIGQEYVKLEQKRLWSLMSTEPVS